MFLLLLPFFLGQDEGPAQAYLRYQSGPLEPLPYDAQRYGPWAPDHESRGKFLITTGSTSIATPNPADYGSAGIMLAQAGSDTGEAIMLDNHPGTRYRWEPLVQGPNDFNLGPYRTDHLFAVVPQHVNEPVQACQY